MPERLEFDLGFGRTGRPRDDTEPMRLLVIGDFGGVNVGTFQVHSRVFLVTAGGQVVPYNGLDQPVQELAELSTGAVVTPRLDRIVAWSSDAWGPTTFAPVSGGMTALAPLSNGNILAAGAFWLSGVGYPPFYIPWTAYYSAAIIGSSSPSYWGYLPQYQNQGVAIARLPNGGFVLGGNMMFGWQSWLLQGFSSTGAVTTTYFGGQGTLNALAATASGDFIVVGSLVAIPGNIAQGNGVTWSPLGSGLAGTVRAVLVTTTGEVIAGGDFVTAGGAPANHIARWDGTSWFPLGAGLDGTVKELLELPNGDLIVGGAFTTAGGAPAANVARWNGTTWLSLSAGTNGTVNALLLASDGTIWVGGDFTSAGPIACSYVARLRPTCPAAASIAGSGCTGSGGANVLTATSLPWAGSIFRSVATGMPANALAVSVASWNTLSIPMPLIFAQGVPGCSLLVWPDVLDLYVPIAGSAAIQFLVPGTPSLVGQVFHQQVVPLELDTAWNIVAITGTNALDLTIGSF